MTKDEAKIRLRKEGYNVVDDNSVVTVLITPDTSLKNTVKEVESKLKALGYDASFSVRQVADAAMSEAHKASEGPAAEDDIEEEIIGNESEPESAGDDSPEVPEAADEGVEDKKDDDGDGDGDDNSGGSVIEYFDDEDSDMILTEDAVQFSLDDFGLNF